MFEGELVIFNVFATTINHKLSNNCYSTRHIKTQIKSSLSDMEYIKYLLKTYIVRNDSYNCSMVTFVVEAWFSGIFDWYLSALIIFQWKQISIQWWSNMMSKHAKLRIFWMLLYICCRSNGIIANVFYYSNTRMIG